MPKKLVDNQYKKYMRRNFDTYGYTLRGWLLNLYRNCVLTLLKYFPLLFSNVIYLSISFLICFKFASLQFKSIIFWMIEHRNLFFTQRVTPWYNF